MPSCSEPRVLLGSDVRQELSLPGLPWLERGQGNAQPDLGNLRGLRTAGLRLCLPTLHELEPAALRNQRAQVPLALEPDPFARPAKRRQLSQILARRRPDTTFTARTGCWP